jgi:MYXO-CTERM domain-containing protein
LILAELGSATFFPLVAKGASCSDTTNDLLKGNCHTDWPDANDELVTVYGVSAADWQNDPSVQELHFLRNYPSDHVDSSKQACVDVRWLVANATQRGLAYWSVGNQASALYWFGHCLHMIQDSFADSHAKRSGTNFRILGDICTYAKQFPGICYHSTLSTADRVWSDALSCQLNPIDRSWDCLLARAQQASIASSGYLRVVARHILAGMTGSIDASLEDWYAKTAPDNFEGYFSCDTLPGQVVYPDAGVDGDADAALDAEFDVQQDGFAADAELDGAEDAELDAIADSPVEASKDASFDVAVDVLPEVGVDAKPEGAADAVADVLVDTKPDSPIASDSAGPDARIDIVDSGAPDRDPGKDDAGREDAGASEANEPAAGPLEESGSTGSCAVAPVAGGGSLAAWGLVALAAVLRGRRRRA